MSPRLVDANFIDRISLRYYFAGVRAANGDAIPEAAARTSGWRRAALLLIRRLVPEFLRGVRIVLVFLILRPFDIGSTLWNRFLGWIVVRLRVRARAVTPP